MAGFLLRRTTGLLGAVMALVVGLHALIFILPGDPIRASFGFRPPPPEVLAATRQRYGADEPYPVQLLSYLQALVTGDLGRSYYGGAQVSALIGDALPVSARIALLGVALGTAAALLAALGAAHRPGGLLDRALRGPVVLLTTVPLVVLALAVAGTRSLQVQRSAWVRGHSELWFSLLLPALTLALVLFAVLFRLTRLALLEQARALYVRAGRGRGLSRGRLVRSHMLRAAAPPLLAVVAAEVAALPSLLFVVEYAYKVPGLAAQTVQAAAARDLPLVIPVLTGSAVFAVTVSLLADTVAGVADPRRRQRRH